jgi:putative drug exporter of the RND superfamily
LKDVAEVRSSTQPLGKNKPSNAIERIAANAFYLSKLPNGNYVARIDVVLSIDPYGADATDVLAALEAWINGVAYQQAAAMDYRRGEVAGVTAATRDIAKTIDSDRIRVNIVATVGVLIILLIVVRKGWLAVFLLLTVLLSYLSTLGLTVLFAHWLTGRPLGAIEWRVPFFLFTILVAVGEDYNILLVTRVLQEKKGRGWREGLIRGLATTGASIAACGIVMAGTFGTLLLTELATLQQIGFALAAGVLIDAFIVRAVLVPSVLALIWQDEVVSEKTVAPATPLGSVVIVGRRKPS